MPGDISSQFISGLLFALPILEGDSELVLTTKLESAPYVDLTLDVLKQFGIKVFYENNSYFVPGNQLFTPREFLVEGDYSNAAFFIVAASLGLPIKVKGLSKFSVQGDKRILYCLEKFGAEFVQEDEGLACKRKIHHHAVIDGSDIPDLVPVLCVAASACDGRSVINGIHRLRLKESDRAHAITDNLTRLGAKVQEDQDSLIIDGGKPLKGSVVSSYKDHRIAMSMAIASCICKESIILEDAQVVNKSYPRFFDDFMALGGHIDVI